MLPIDSPRDDASQQIGENYLKVILLVHMEIGKATIPAVGKAMNISKSRSYSIASRLVKEGMIQPLARCGSIKEYGHPLELTPIGQKTAEDILKKYYLIQKWLLCIGIPPEEADVEACRWEHTITNSMLGAIQKQTEMLKPAKRGRPAKNPLAPLLRERKKASGMTTIESMLSLFDEYGGIEGFRRRDQLIERAGSVERLEELLDTIDQLGGFRRFKTQSAILLQMGSTSTQQAHTTERLERLEGLIETAGGIRNLKMKIRVLQKMEPDLYRRVSNVEQLKETLETVDALGGLRKLKAVSDDPHWTDKQAVLASLIDAKTLTKFKEMSDALGGIDRLVALMYRNYKVWTSIIPTPDQEE